MKSSGTSAKSAEVTIVILPKRYLRRCIEKISEEWEGLEESRGDDLDVAVSQTPHEVKE